MLAKGAPLYDIDAARPDGAGFVERDGNFDRRRGSGKAAAFRANAAELTWFGGYSYKRQISGRQRKVLLPFPATMDC